MKRTVLMPPYDPVSVLSLGFRNRSNRAVAGAVTRLTGLPGVVFKGFRLSDPRLFPSPAMRYKTAKKL